MILFGVRLEFDGDVFEAVVNLQLGFKHNGFEISCRLVSAIILERLSLSLFCLIAISDVLLISHLELVVVVSHVQSSQRLIKMLLIDAGIFAKMVPLG